MKNINISLDDERHGDLKFIQDYYSQRTGAKVSQAQAMRRLLYETANLIRNTGETYPNRDWTFDNQERKITKGASNGSK